MKLKVNKVTFMLMGCTHTVHCIYQLVLASADTCLKNNCSFACFRVVTKNVFSVVSRDRLSRHMTVT